MKIKKTCPICNKIFKTWLSQNSICCSRKCKGINESKKAFGKNKKICQTCKKVFLPKHTTATKGLYCSHKCFGITQRKPVIMRSGYKYLYLPNHPNASKQGYYAEHRLVVENRIGRYLDKKEIIHHVNHDKADNRIWNLMILPSVGKHFIQKHFKHRNPNGTFAE